MPNNVSSKITFTCSNELAEKILSEICNGNNTIDFNTLIPQPLNVYKGKLSQEEDRDFGCNTWHEWNCANWNTKWNAYNGRSTNNDGEVEIYFETAWNIPYPFVIAFANKYNLEFTYKYFDEGHNFWGVEKWGKGLRIDCNRNHEGLKKELHIELFGWDYESDEED